MAGQIQSLFFQERNSKMKPFLLPHVDCLLFSACQKNASTQEGETGTIPPELEGLTELIEELHQGNPVDIDGDGFQELFYEELDEQINVYVDLPTGENVFFATLSQNGDLTALYDLDENEQADLEYTWNAATSTAVVYRDDDGDGYPEQRSTFVRDASAGVYYYQTEHDLEASGEYSISEEGSFSESSETTISQNKNRIDHSDFFKFENPFSNNVCPDGSQKVFFGLPMVYICEGEVDGSCTPEESSMLKSAFACMFERYKTCIRNTNKTTWYNFLLHMSLSGITGGAGIKCTSDLKVKNEKGEEKDVLANSTMNFLVHDASITFNRLFFYNQTEHDTCSIAIHEFMHVLSVGFWDEERKEEHNKGLDTIYACGRYCGFCSKYTTGEAWKFDSNNVECFVCADSAERKKACGFREELVTGRCHENYSVCHAGLSCLMSPCEKCGESAVAKSCHQNSEDQKEFDWRNVGSWCCQECPATCNSSNDMPCSDIYIDPNLQDTCSKPPPYCSSTHGAD